MITRYLEESIRQRLNKKKAIIIIGARQVGKTTLLRQIFEKKDNALWLNGDGTDIQALFKEISATRLKAIFGNKQYIIIDEAQRIPDIGLRLKLITDQLPEYQLIFTSLE